MEIQAKINDHVVIAFGETGCIHVHYSPTAKALEEKYVLGQTEARKVLFG
jgi:hypothetical protein